MLGFFLNLYKLLRAIWHGIKYDQEFRVLLNIYPTPTAHIVYSTF